MSYIASSKRHTRCRPALRRGTAAIAIGASALGAAGAAPAVAAPIPAEVVSRADGTAGWAPLRAAATRLPGAISSDGRLSAFTWGDKQPYETGFTSTLYVRDIVSNRTHTIVTGGYSAATSFDRNNRLLAFISDQKVTADDTDSTPDLYLLDTQNGNKALIGRASGVSGAHGVVSQGLVSGDGKSVVFVGEVPGLGEGVFRRDLVTNTTAKIAPAINTLNGERITSVSDDGRVVATSAPESVEAGAPGGLISPAGSIDLDGNARVSPDGSTVAYVRQSTAGSGTRPQLVVRRVSTGAETTTDLPKPAESPDGFAADYFNSDAADVLWISPDGGQVALGVGRLIDSVFGGIAPPPLLFTRSNGTLVPITGPFAKGLRTSQHTPQAAISRTGRYGLVFGQQWIGQLWAVDVWNQALPGGVDPAPATEYVFNPSFHCDFEHQGRFGYSTPAVLNPAWAEGAKSIRLKLVVDGKVLADVTSTPAKPAAISLDNLDVETAKSQTLSVNVLTKSGKSITGSWTEPVVLPIDECPAGW